MRDLLERLVVGAAVPVAASAPRLDGHSLLLVDGVRAELLVLALDQAGYAVSAGSACTAGESEPSHVLLAQGLTPEQSRSVIRVSLGLDTTVAEIEGFAVGAARGGRPPACRRAAARPGRSLGFRPCPARPSSSHALSAQRAGSCDAAGWVGVAGSDSCGDRLQVELAVRDGRVVQARYRAHACVHATAAAALVCELAEGRQVLDAACIGESDLEQALEPEPGHQECLALAVDALHVALASALVNGSLPPVAGRAVVAMSGGVDSAVALLKSVEQGSTRSA